MKNASALMFALCVMHFAMAGPGLAAEDYSGKRLLDSDFSGKVLHDARFDGTVLRGSVFNGADLTGASFRKADVRGVSFKGAIGLDGDANAFRNALYSSTTVWPDGFSPPASATYIEAPDKAATTKAAPADAPALSPAAEGTSPAASQGTYVAPASGVDKSGQNLAHGSFSGYLAGANFAATVLDFASFNGADLEGASFRNAEIRWTSFRHANLVGADFTGAKLDGPYFIGANLSRANLENQILRLGGWAGYFEAPKLDPDLNYGYDLKREMLGGDPDRTHNEGLILKGANLKRTVISGDLRTVDFRRADLRGADLSDTTNAEPRFFKHAIYDTATVWPAHFDAAAAGAIKGEDLPPLSAANGATGAAAAQEGFGISGHVWMITSPGETQGKLIYVYPDGSYVWRTAQGEIEQRWESDAEAGGIHLQQGPMGEDWSATPTGPEGITLRAIASGGTLDATRSGDTQ